MLPFLNHTLIYREWSYYYVPVPFLFTHLWSPSESWPRRQDLCRSSCLVLLGHSPVSGYSAQPVSWHPFRTSVPRYVTISYCQTLLLTFRPRNWHVTPYLNSSVPLSVLGVYVNILLFTHFLCKDFTVLFCSVPHTLVVCRPWGFHVQLFTRCGRSLFSVPLSMNSCRSISEFELL